MSFLNQRPPTSILVAQAVGITASTYMLGQNASLSFVGMPAVMLAPAPLAAKQWAKVYDTAKMVGIPLAIVSSLSTAYVAYKQDPASLPFKLNVAATLLFPAIIPFTIFFIGPINEKLFDKADNLAAVAIEDKAAEKGVAKEETVHALIDKWATLNLARAGITGAGVIAVVWAALDRTAAFTFADAALRTGANRLG